MGLWHGAGFPVGAERLTFVPGLPMRRNRLDPGLQRRPRLPDSSFVKLL
jgi:hypothetical protein